MHPLHRPGRLHRHFGRCPGLIFGRVERRETESVALQAPWYPSRERSARGKIIGIDEHQTTVVELHSPLSRRIDNAMLAYPHAVACTVAVVFQNDTGLLVVRAGVDPNRYAHR
ncbi:MAG: hypothetical protein QOD39_1842 [Mycobacterium sp.]|nr:hypothetical protein [Mycobacterium sp.]